MSSKQYKQALAAAEKEFAAELEKWKESQARAIKLKKTIHALQSLCEQEAVSSSIVIHGVTPDLIEELGITEMCRHIVRTANRPLTPIEIRDRLVLLGLDLDKYANPLASIHTILKRLVESGEATAITMDEGSKTMYEQKPASFFLPSSPRAGAFGGKRRKRLRRRQGLSPMEKILREEEVK